MNVSQAINERREITSFTKEPLTKDTLEEILEAGYLAPTGNNLPSRDFILILTRSTLNDLEKTTPFMPWLKEATAAIVITGRPEISKYWLQDASISGAFIWLRATELLVGVGFGAVYHAEDPQESFKREQWVRQILCIPADRRIVAILGLGKSKNKPVKKQLPPRDDIIHYDHFSSSSTQTNPAKEKAAKSNNDSKRHL
ncbi:Nitroreductase [Evansella caseinilytica]|uniref:Nitroreductase n=1 Tax=Evansella caseinilytica TaxID=1503961 RepID=A0A1H3SL76_9BACI|nr:nitroreductase family protein [Evansella caseinilytica]SDZ38732.1 Nitroreductase [Evansella caseinilytica]